MKEIIGSLAALAGTTIAGNITIATVPTVVSTVVPATGIAGWLGFTATATTVVAAPVTLPAASVVAIGGLLWCGSRMAYEYFSPKDSG